MGYNEYSSRNQKHYNNWKSDSRDCLLPVSFPTQLSMEELADLGDGKRSTEAYQFYDSEEDNPALPDVVQWISRGCGHSISDQVEDFSCYA